MKNQKVTTFKEAWNPTHAEMSLRANGMYEAGAALYWADTTGGRTGNVMETYVMEPSWHEVQSFMNVHVPEKSVMKNGRLLFAQTLACYGDLSQLVPAAGFPSNVFMLSGKIFVYAWYLAMCEALIAKNNSRITRLHEMALTVTFRAHLEADMNSMLRWSLHASELLRKAEQQDSFLMFARKICQLVGSEDEADNSLAALQADNICFNGQKINKASLNACKLLCDNLNEKGEECLRNIDRMFGRDVWNGAYFKMMRLCQLTKTAQQLWARDTVPDMVTFLLETCYVLLKRGDAKPTFFTNSCVDTRGSDRPGWIATTLTKMHLLGQMLDFLKAANQVCEGSVAELVKDVAAMEKMRSPLSWDATMPAVPEEEDDDGELEDSQATTLAQESLLVEGHDPLGQLQADLSKAGKLFVALADDLWKGSYETELKALCSTKDVCQGAMDDAEGKCKKLGKALKDAISVGAPDERCRFRVVSCRQKEFLVLGLEASHGTFSPAVATMQLSTGSGADTSASKMPRVSEALHLLSASGLDSKVGCAPMSLRQLVKTLSNESADLDVGKAERDKLWREAQQARKKKAQLALLKSASNKDSWQSLYSKTAAKTFDSDGLLNENHRLFVVCLDAWLEEKDAHTTKRPVDASLLEGVFGFLKQQVMEHDLLLILDGCEAANRDIIQKEMGGRVPGGGGLYSFTVLHEESKPAGKRSRKVFCGSMSVETAYLRINVPRVRLAVSDRTDPYVPPGAAKTTHNMNLVGVPGVSARQLPRILLTDKQKIFPDAEMPKDWKASSVPLFWNETKGTKFWETVIEMLNVGQIVDCTPGSGCLAKLCLSYDDVSYLAILEVSIT